MLKKIKQIDRDTLGLCVVSLVAAGAVLGLTGNISMAFLMLMPGAIFFYVGM